ncbi:MAG TPA: YceI family protein [Tenuifilaceae bacterium]|nr:YceI family protein [Tenuifilaceae bacterium]
MKMKGILAPAVLLALVATSCMQAPKGDKVDTGDAFKITPYEHGQELKADVALSKIDWLGTKPGGEHFGTLSIKEGSIFVEKGQILGGKFTMDVNSIAVLDLQNPEMNAYLVNHLKSADFFSVDSFPQAYFEFSSIVPITHNHEEGEGFVPTHRIDGNLTIKGITKSISFNALIKLDEGRLQASTPQFLINRTNWKVNYGSQSIIANLKDNIIHDEMGVAVHLTAY